MPGLPVVAASASAAVHTLFRNTNMLPPQVAVFRFIPSDAVTEVVRSCVTVPPAHWLIFSVAAPGLWNPLGTEISTDS